jgi:hypothetical protein
VTSFPQSRRFLRVTETVLLLLTAVLGYRSCVLDQSGDPEKTMPAIVATLELAALLIGCVAIDILWARPTLEPGVQMAAGNVDFGGAAAMTSAVAGVLAWLPLIPLAGPIVYASVATLAGLVALRHLQRGHTRRGERRIAIVGAVAGVANLLFHFVLSLGR